jgi:hypothetical protein
VIGLATDREFGENWRMQADSTVTEDPILLDRVVDGFGCWSELREGYPVRSAWLGKQSVKPVHAATDLISELKRGGGPRFAIRNRARRRSTPVLSALLTRSASNIRAGEPFELSAHLAAG